MPVTYPSHAEEPSASPFEFVWDIAKSGHQWRQLYAAEPASANDEPQWFLTDGHLLGVPREVSRYAPLRSEPALFRTFADLDPTRDQVRSFADRFGNLGGDASTIVVIPRADGSDATGSRSPARSGSLATGERLRHWAAEIGKMRDLVELWEAARVDAPVLGERVSWSSQSVKYQSGRRWAIILDRRIDTEAFARLRPGDLVAAAMIHIQRCVNKELQERCTARLLWDQDRTRLDLRVVPRSLIGALWLQFARAVDGDRRFMTCVQCGRWMELSPDVRRSDARTCSGACRTRAYRERVRARRHRVDKASGQRTPVRGPSVR